jgi:hypothetical protein
VRKRRRSKVRIRSANIPSVFQSHKELFSKVHNPKPLQGGQVGTGPNAELNWLGVATENRDSQAQQQGHVYPIEVGSKKYKKANKKFLKKVAVNEAKEARRLGSHAIPDKNAHLRQTQFEFTTKLDFSKISKPGDVTKLIKEDDRQRKIVQGRNPNRKRS